jgi:hypothetical protein
VSARVIRVIETRLEVRGDGRDVPLRAVTQYWSEDGDLLAEADSWCDRFTFDRLEKAARDLVDLLEVKDPRGSPDAYIEQLRRVLDRKDRDL